MGTKPCENPGRGPKQASAGTRRGENRLWGLKRLSLGPKLGGKSSSCPRSGFLGTKPTADVHEDRLKSDFIPVRPPFRGCGELRMRFIPKNAIVRVRNGTPGSSVPETLPPRGCFGVQSRSSPFCSLRIRRCRYRDGSPGPSVRENARCRLRDRLRRGGNSSLSR